MKVLVATGMYPPSVGGPATYSKLLNDELPKRGIAITIASFDNLRILPVGIRHFLYFIKLLIDGIGTDIIYAQDPVSVGYPAMLAAKILKKKFVLKVVGDYAWEQGTQRFDVNESLDDFVKGLKEYHPRVSRMKKIQRKVADHADRIIVPSRYLKKIVSQWGIDENKIMVIYNSFEISNFDKTKEESRKELGFDNLTIFTAGRLVPWKGFGTLISMMPNLLKKFPELQLIIAGSGPQREELDKLVSEEKLYKNVHLTGSLPKEDLFMHVKAADAFVLNTGYEGFSHQILEVLSLGTPLVTTNIGGNPEIIVDEENGLLVDYNDEKELELAIEKILTDKKLVDKIIEKGKESVSGYGRERMLEELVNELKGVL